ncbi:MAG: hypothetical protein NZ578_15890 [Candidatus Binatia bacterium]|nr:hypothetical protein [Candidatus Binatia bacterium]
MMRMGVIVLFLLTSAATGLHAEEQPIVDTLRGTPLTTQFSIFTSWGTAIYNRAHVGVQFTLGQPSVLTEIGAFVNNCHTISGGVPQCPETQPFTVHIHPAAGNGGPDLSTTLAVLVLSHDDDPLVVSYESVATHLRLKPGTYFAMFVPQGGDGGILLRSATQPFDYVAEVATISTVDPQTGTATLSRTPAAVRLLGLPLVSVVIDIKPRRFPNYVNRKAKALPVAVLTTATFDATTVDPTTVLFGASGVEAFAVRSSLKDVDGDGDTDLLLHFNLRETGLACTDTAAVLTGETFDGRTIEGTDTVKVQCQ